MNDDPIILTVNAVARPLAIARHLPLPMVTALSSEGEALINSANDKKEVDKLLQSANPKLIREIATLLASAARTAPKGPVDAELSELPLYKALIKSYPDIFDCESVPEIPAPVIKKTKSKSKQAKEPTISLIVERDTNDTKSMMVEDPDGGAHKSAVLLNESAESYLEKADKDLLKTISTEIAKLIDTAQLNLADGDILARLIVGLDSVVQSGMVSFWSDDRDTAAKKGKKRTRQELAAELVDTESQAQINDALDASISSLRIMSSDGMPRTVFVEEVLEDCVRLLKHLLDSAMYPVFESKVAEEDGEVKDPSKNRAAANELLHAQKLAIQPLIGSLVSMYDRLQEVVERESVQDSLLVSLASVSIGSFFSEAPNSLQLCAMDLLRAIFFKFPKHRPIIMDEIIASLAKLPTSKRNLRACKVYGKDASIQNVTALVLNLVQCCAGIDEGNDDYSMEAVSNAANIFLVPFISRCTTRGASGDAVDYRGLLENIVVDLIVVVSTPEYPATELLLHYITVAMVRLVTDKTTESQVRYFAMDILGLITARVRHDISVLTVFEKTEYCYCRQAYETEFMIQCDECDVWFHGDCAGIAEDAVPDIWVCDLCNAKKHVITQVNSIVSKNVEVKTVEPKKKPKQRKGRKTKKAKKTEEWGGSAKLDLESLIAADPHFLLRQLLLDYLEVRGMPFARKYMLAQWYSESENEVVMDFLRSEWSPKDAWSTSSASFKVDRLELALQTLASKRPLVTGFDNVLLHILASLTESSGMLRVRGVKALACIVEADPSILGDQRVQAAVMNRFLDSSIMVRDSAVDLVGRFLFFRPEYVDQYYDQIARRLLDTGVSVRKRVVKIMRSICQRVPDHEKINDILVRLVGRMGDEDGVRDMVTMALEDVWFSSLVKKDSNVPEEASMKFLQHLQQRKSETSKGDLAAENFIQILMSVPQAETDDDGEKVEPDVPQTQLKAYGELHRRAMQIVYVVSQSQQHDWLESLLESLLIREGDSVDEEQWDDLLSAEDVSKHVELLKTHPIRTLCSALIADLVEHILALEEEQANDSRMLHCLNALGVFASVLPQQVAAHIDTLVPYLTPRTGLAGAQAAEEQTRLSTVATILWHIVPYLRRPPVSLLETLERQLTVLVYGQGVSVVQASVKCLCALVDQHTHNTILLQEMITKFHKYLDSNTGFRSSGAVRYPTLTRSLFTAGLLFRHFDFDSILMEEEDWDGDGFFPGHMGESLFGVYIQYCRTVLDMLDSGTGGDGVSEVLLRSLQGLGHLLVRRPQLAVDQRCSAVLTASLKPTAPSAIKTQGLRVFADFLADEEERLQQVNAANGFFTPPLASLPPTPRAMIPARPRSVTPARLVSTPAPLGSASRPETPVSQRGDSGVSSGLIQVHLNSILLLTEDAHDIVRVTAVNVIGLILRHGLVLPVLCVPALVAREVDHNQQIRDATHRILGFVVDRYPTFAKNPSVVMQGLSMAHRFMAERRVYHTTDVGKYYALAFRGDRSARNQLITVLVKEFETAKNTEYLVFLTELLATLPYSVQDEPLYVVHCINRTLSLKGALVLSHMCDMFASVRSDAVYDSDKDTYAPIDGAVASSARVSMEELSVQCRAMVLLMTLKAHIKGLYQLSDKVCATYSPLNPPPVPRPVSKNSDIVLDSREGLNHLDNPPKSGGGDGRWEYEVFKRLMGSDSGDDIGAHINVVFGKKKTKAAKRKKEPPKPKKKKKRRRRMSESDSEEEGMDSSDTEYKE